jgi:hypothetical protein
LIPVPGPAELPSTETAAGLDAQLLVVAAVLMLPLITERDTGTAGGDPAGADAAG